VRNSQHAGRRTGWGLVALVAVAVSSLVGCSKIRARAQMQDGNKAYKEGSYEEALARFEQGLSLDRKATFAFRSVGLSAMALFRPGDTSPANLKWADKAISAFQTYLKDYPNDEKVEEWMVSLWVTSERYEKAIDYLKQQKRNHPGEPKYNTAIVSILIKAAHFQEAYAFADQYSGKDAKIYYTIATSAWGKSYGDPTTRYEDRVAIVDLGLKAVQRAVDLRPDFSDAMVYFNLLYREKAKVDLDPERQKQWLAQADEWRAKAIALREAQKAKPGSTAASAAAPTKG